MSDTIPIEYLINKLLTEHDVSEVTVETTVRVKIPLDTQIGDGFTKNRRERRVSGSDLESLVEDTHFMYNGTIDVPSDFCVEDKITGRRTIENND